MYGGDSDAVQGQLTKVKQIQASWNPGGPVVPLFCPYF